MAGFDRRLQDVLGGAISAGRAMLHDLDPDDVPARLRKVAQTTGGRLPPPLAASLLAEIEANEAVRQQVLETFRERGTEDVVAEAFLARPDGWWLIVISEIVDLMDRETIAATEELARRGHELSERLAAAKQERARLKQELARKGPDDATAAESIDRLRSRLEGATHRVESEEAAHADTAGRLEAVAAELGDVERRSAELYRRLREIRVERAALLRTVESGGKESLPRDPLALAAVLDSTAATMAPFRAAAADAPREEPTAEDLRLPAGVRPDEPEAVTALVALSPGLIIVDGHNVLGVIDRAAMGSAKARKRFVRRLGRLSRAVVGGNVVVVFDSALVGGRATVTTPEGVTVRFSEQSELADDVIVELTARAEVRVAVFSNDRDVRERCTRFGALTLWADALAGWLDTTG